MHDANERLAQKRQQQTITIGNDDVGFIRGQQINHVAHISAGKAKTQPGVGKFGPGQHTDFISGAPRFWVIAPYGNFMSAAAQAMGHVVGHMVHAAAPFSRRRQTVADKSYAHGADPAAVPAAGEEKTGATRSSHGPW